MARPSKSSLVSLLSLTGTFVIPAYQRAYRWGTKQVENLLEDFYEFAQGDGKTFFLQPLVLHCQDRQEKVYELIDGQQRLITLYLLDALLRGFSGSAETGLRYRIVYESREGLDKFFQQLVGGGGASQEESAKSLDFYCLFHGRQIILDWLKNKDPGSFLSVFHAKLLNNVKFLWHDSSVEDGSSPAQKYIRLNTGRIPLADGELCRALFLLPRNHDLSEELPAGPTQGESHITEHMLSRLLYKRRFILAHEWDEIERSLWDESFWNFIGGRFCKDSVRTGFLLELHNNIKPSLVGEHVCFAKYGKVFKTINKKWDAGQAWVELVKTLERLRYWHRDNDYYHWIGFLVLVNGSEKLAFLLKQARLLPEDEFRSLVKEEIRTSISPDGPPQLDELSFQNNYGLCKNILLLFNVEYSRRHQGHSPRFPFSDFSLESNTIEHVYARNVESLKEMKDRIHWIEEHRNFVSGLEYEQMAALNRSRGGEDMSPGDFYRRKMELLNMADTFIDQARNVEKPVEDIMSESFNALSDALSKFIENHEDEDVHSIYNLALLDHDLNSYFRNSIFAIKQKKLRQCLLAGHTFIPAGTIALFMRHFAKERREAPWWTREDQEDYRDVLRDILGEFWPELRKVENEARESSDGTP